MLLCQKTCTELEFCIRKLALEERFHKGKCFPKENFLFFYGEVLQAATMKVQYMRKHKKTAKTEMCLCRVSCCCYC